MPEVNVAHTRFGGQVLQGEMRTALLDGDTTNYDMERGTLSNHLGYENIPTKPPKLNYNHDYL